MRAIVACSAFCCFPSRGFFLPGASAPPPEPSPGQDYEQNGVGEKHGRVRLNRLSGRKVGGLYGARKAEIGRTFQEEEE